MLQLHSMTPRQRKALDIAATAIFSSAILWGFWSFFQGQVVYDLFSNDASRFRDYLQGMGPWAWFVYIWLVMLEVLIAFIPGWFVYPVGGALFGFGKTVILVLIANFIGASVSFWIGRKWGSIVLKKFIAEKYTTQLNAYMEKRGAWAIFFLKLNPLTSLDLWNYVAGATPMSYWKFIIANIVGITPLVLFSAALGEESYNVAPQLLGVLVLVTVIYIVWYLINIPNKIKGLK